MQFGTSYFGNRWPEHAATDIKAIRRGGCDWILHTFDEVDLKFNRGNLKRLTDLSHRQGLKVYYSPWAVGGIFGGESLSAFTGYHPDACQVLNTGERTAHACPAHPEFRKFIRGWIKAAIQAGGDVLFWDEPHLWIASWEGRKENKNVFSIGSLYAQTLWKKRHGNKPLPRSRTAEVDAFRSWLLFDFLRWATSTAKRLKPSIKNAVCLLPHVDQWPNPLWEKVAALKSVDIFATDPYWKSIPTSNPKTTPLEGYVDLMSERLVDLGRRHKKEVQAWVQLFALRRQDHGSVLKALTMMEKAGVRNIGAWGYRGCEAFSNIASEEPGRLWSSLCTHIRGMRRRVR